MYEFDLKTLWHRILSKKKMLIQNVILAVVGGVVVAYSIPKVYVSEVELVAEVKSSDGLGGNAASLASLAGIKMGNSEESLVPELYPNVMGSNSFAVELLAVPVETKDGAFKGTYLEYLNTQTKSPWWSYPMQWLRSIGSSSSDDDSGESVIDPEHLSSDLAGIVAGVKSTVLCDVSSGDGLIKIIARAQDPVVAKQLVDAATIKLQKFITDYRTNKARIDLKYYQQLEKEALADYRKAQQEFAAYSETHKDISSQYYLIEKTRYENEMQFAFSIYSQIAQQVHVAMAKVQENTPAFTTINAAAVPPTADSPKKKVILFAVVFLAVLVSLGWIYFRLLFEKKEDKAEVKVVSASEQQVASASEQQES